jgi:hypothetical protein
MFRVKAAALAAIVAALPACGAGTSGPREPRRTLPVYLGHAAELFDDAFEPEALGFELVPTAPAARNFLLRERTQVGDYVVRALLTTVTSTEEDRGRSWQLAFQTIETLAGSHPPEARFTVKAGPDSPSAGYLRALEGRLIGKTFVAFVREFAHPGDTGASDLHFHLAPDAKPEVEAVRVAVATDSVR